MVEPQARRWCTAETVTYADLGEEAVLLETQRGLYFGLDAVGNRVWQLLNADASMAEICNRLLAEYEVEPEQLQADVANLLRALEAEQLIRPA